MSPGKLRNTPPSLYQNSNITPRLYGQNCKFCTTPLSDKSQKRLVHKENQTKYRNMTRKPRSHVRIVIYRTWAIRNAGQLQVAICFHRLCVRKLKPLRSQKVKPRVQLKQGRHQTTTMRSRRGFFFQVSRTRGQLNPVSRLCAVQNTRERLGLVNQQLNRIY